LFAHLGGWIAFGLVEFGGAGPATATAVICYAAGSVLFAIRRYGLGQGAAALALLPTLASGIGHLLGTEVIFGRQPALVVLVTVLIGAAMLGGTAHRGAIRVFLSKTISGNFARKQLLIATVAPIAVAVFFTLLLPDGQSPAALAETVAAIIVICWITFGATALVGRRLDIKRHKAEAELRNMARHDALTGLLNRRSMNIAMPQRHAEARAEGRPITLMMCDLDHFKRLNDEHGHAIGDEILRRVAQRVNAAVRDSDLVFRYGGEELAVLLDCGSGDAIRIAEKIREAVKAPTRRQADLDLPPVTISVGAATSARGGTELKALMAAADECLYAAKRAGRDCVRHVSLP
jgi:diguanylate cyclase (GGDEF)-like protein